MAETCCPLVVERVRVRGVATRASTPLGPGSVGALVLSGGRLKVYNKLDFVRSTDLLSVFITYAPTVLAAVFEAGAL